MRCFCFVMKKGVRLHKMDDWKHYRVDSYRRIITNGSCGGLEERQIAQRVYENNMGIYESLKSYEDGVAYNDGSWLLFNTGRSYKRKDKVLFKDKIFCQDKSQVINDLYSYVLFLRKMGIDVAYEMNYYAVAFLTKYLRFIDKVFDCTEENKKKVGELCLSVCHKNPEEINCDSRRDSRQFAFDPDKLKKMNPSAVTKWQKRIQKQITDEHIRKWYNSGLSVRKNVETLRSHGVIISVGRMYQWIKEYAKA